MRPRQHPDVESELTLDGALDASGDAGRIAVAPEDDVAALEVRLDILAAERDVQRAQARHRDQVVAPDVDPPQERDVAVRHATTVRRGAIV